MRMKYFIANWKMNKTWGQALRYVENLKNKLNEIDLTDKNVVIAPSIFHLLSLSHELENTPIKLSSQNCFYEQQGTFTGEVSPIMLQDMGIKYCIIGHSERRKYFNETDEIVNKKVNAMLEFKVSPILCVGEEIDTRKEGKAKDFIQNQVKKSLYNVIDNIDQVIIAYEPIWAISPGLSQNALEQKDLVATPEDAQQAIVWIREILADLYGNVISKNMPILYGGSVKSTNVHALLAQPDIDGFLIGGASLDVDEFLKIIN